MIRAAFVFSCSTLAAVEGGFASWKMTTEDEPRRFRVEGRQFFVDGAPFHIKGVCWSPVPRGGKDPNDIDYAGFADSDSDLMVEAGINTIRVYSPILNHTVLDIFHSKGIHVINMAYVWGGANISTVAPIINAVKDHPAIIAWEVGNEWNYNHLYYRPPEGDIDTFEKARQRVIDVVAIVKQHDTVHPVVTVYGEIPSQETVDMLSQVDIWAINAYRSIDFRDLFESFAALTDKPMYLGEYGADAYDANINASNETAQADATRVLTEQIISKSSINGGVCIGGLIFEFADEWWKAPGSPNTHDIGGIAPGGGPYPDKTFNEEWWGLLKIDRTPRLAWEEYKKIGPPVPNNHLPKWVVWVSVLVAIVAIAAIGWYINRPKDANPAETEMLEGQS